LRQIYKQLSYPIFIHLYLAIMGLSEVCFVVTGNTKILYSCVTFLWSDCLCPLATYMTANYTWIKNQQFLKSEIAFALPFSAEVKNVWSNTSTHLHLHNLVPHLMLLTVCLTYIRNSAVLVSSFPREYCNWALHVVYYNMGRFRVTREVKFRSSCCVPYLWKIKKWPIINVSNKYTVLRIG
jgi:hypothetical protein